MKFQKPSTADAIVANAFALGEALGVSPAGMARAALTAVVATCEQSGDPDGMLAALMTTRKGENHGR